MPGQEREGTINKTFKFSCKLTVSFSSLSSGGILCTSSTSNCGYSCMSEEQVEEEEEEEEEWRKEEMNEVNQI